MVKKTS